MVRIEPIRRTSNGCIDPGFSSSKFAITILQLEDNIVKVIYAKKFDRASYEKMISLVTRLKVQFRPTKISIHGSKPDIMKSLKSLLNEQSRLLK